LAVHGIGALAGQPGAAAPAMQVPPRPGRAHLMKVLELLARAELVDSAEPFVAWAQRTAAPLSWGATVIAITPSADELTCQGLHRLARAGLNVVMLVVEPYGRFGVIQERARRLGFTAYLVASEDDLNLLQALSGARVPAYRGVAP
jgi:hypothetical protein